jgi:nucleoside-diphosphate-sugar epimerase
MRASRVPHEHAPQLPRSGSVRASQGPVRRLVYLSSETAGGYVTAKRPFRPEYVPIDEAITRRPQDALALAKSLGEDIIDALVSRFDTTAVSIRRLSGWDPKRSWRDHV